MKRRNKPRSRPHNRKNRETNVHHLIASSIGGKNNAANKVEALITKHNALHLLFNNLAPHNQLIELLRINSKVIKTATLEQILEVLQTPVEAGQFYVQQAVDRILEHKQNEPKNFEI